MSTATNTANKPLSVTVRQAVRDAIRSNPGYDRGTMGPVNGMDKATLHNVAATLGIDVAAIERQAVAAQTAAADETLTRLKEDMASEAAPQTTETQEGKDKRQDMAKDETVSAAPAAPAIDIGANADAIVDSVIGPLEPFLADKVLAKLRADIAPIAVKASAGPEIVVKEKLVVATADQMSDIDRSVKIEKRISAVDAFDVKNDGSDSFRILANTMVDVYNDPRAPDIDAHFVWNTANLTIALAALHWDKGLWLGGPKGTGKTTMCEQIAARLGRRFVRVTFDRMTEPADLLGGMGLRGGNSEHIAGVVTDGASTPGAIILLDEPSKCRPGVHAALQQVMDCLRIVLKDNGGKIVPVARAVSFWVADNTFGSGDETGVYQDAMEVDAAFQDRFAGLLRVDYLPKKAEIAALMNRTSLDHGAATSMVEFAALTRKAHSQGALIEAIGFRRLISWAQFVLSGIPSDHAFAVAVLNMAKPDDCEGLRNLEVASCDHNWINHCIHGTAATHSGSGVVVTAEGESAAREFDVVDENNVAA